MLNIKIKHISSVKLSWSHYCELLNTSDRQVRSFYQHESINANWSIREMKRQIDTSLFERLLLSEGNANKEKRLELFLDLFHSLICGYNKILKAHVF